MAGKKPTLDLEIAELYGLPFEEWTAARNALAKRLSGEGRKADAGTVKALPKPSVSAWAVNQLFRSEGEGMGELLAAGRRARAAQGEAVAGRGAEAFREALGVARRQIETLRRRAVALLGKAGKGTSAAISERIGRNLEALAFSPAAAAEGARGYLDADLDPPGFEVLSGLRLRVPPQAPKAAQAAPHEPSAPSPPSPPKPRQAASAAASAAESVPAARPSRLLQFKKSPPKESRAVAAARKREEAEAARRVRAEARQRERAERAATAVRQAEERAAALRGEADAADRQAAEVRRQAVTAERAATAARRRAEAAEAEVDRARERLAGLAVDESA
jgi:hypothetical protein